MTKLGLKSGLLNNLPHGVAHVRISRSPIGDVEEFFAVFFKGDFIDGKYNAYVDAQIAFNDLNEQEAA